MDYYVHLHSNKECFKAIVTADNFQEAENTLIANIDSGDYDHFLRGRDFECGEIALLSHFVVNSPDVFTMNRILPIEAQIIYYTKGLYPRKDNLHDVRTLLQFSSKEKGSRIPDWLIEKVIRRVYRKLYLEGFLAPINVLNLDGTERFLQYVHAIAALDDSLIDIPINKELFDIIKRKIT